MKKNSEAEELLTKALNIEKAINGPVNKSVATSHNFLGNLNMDNMKQYTKAEEHFLQSIKIREELFDPAYSEHVYNALIDLYETTGDDAKRAEYEEKIEEWEKLQNKDNEEEMEDGEPKKMNFQEIINFVTET